MAEIATTNDSNSTSVYVALAITGIILLIAVAIVFIDCRRKKKSKTKQEESTRKSCIFSYLQQFDVEDIDLRRAPTGGWHGTYVNKLAYGVNEFEETKSDSSSDEETVIIIDSDDSDDSYDFRNINDDNKTDNNNNHDIENGWVIQEKFEKAKSLFMDATESMPYYGLSSVDEDHDNHEHHPWTKTKDDTI